MIKTACVTPTVCLFFLIYFLFIDFLFFMMEGGDIGALLLSVSLLAVDWERGPVLRDLEKGILGRYSFCLVFFGRVLKGRTCPNRCINKIVPNATF